MAVVDKKWLSAFAYEISLQPARAIVVREDVPTITYCNQIRLPPATSSSKLC
jgi:hypothetical protein